VEYDGLALVTRGGAYGKMLSGDVGVASKKKIHSVAVEKKEGNGMACSGRKRLCFLLSVHGTHT